MSKLLRKWGALGVKLCLGVSLALSVSLGGYALASDDDEDEDALKPTAEEQARFDAYMRNIVPVYFPAVPFGWKVEVDSNENVVKYTHQDDPNSTYGSFINGQSSPMSTTIKMYYTRKTMYRDAAAYMNDYVIKNNCAEKSQQGNGFYTTSCRKSNTYAIVIGEVDNLYLIELIGNYNHAAQAIIEQYVGNIVNGKKVFANRDIGDINMR